jgi:hypothetical protein
VFSSDSDVRSGGHSPGSTSVVNASAPTGTTAAGRSGKATETNCDGGEPVIKEREDPGARVGTSAVVAQKTRNKSLVPAPQ